MMLDWRTHQINQTVQTVEKVLLHSVLQFVIVPVNSEIYFT
jgi:hypothetical protein